MSFVVFILLTAATMAFGGLFRPGPWYEALDKPALTPPGWVFPVVWALLYLMIAVAGWLIWRNRGKSPFARRALAFWGAQLFFNAMWSWLFFGLQSPGMALADIVVLWTLIVGTVITAWQVKPVAGALLVPYLAWVSFAVWLNGMIWHLN